MSFPLPVDLIRWADLNKLDQLLSLGDQRIRYASKRIMYPMQGQNSVFNYRPLKVDTMRLLALCHDHRKYKTKSEAGNGYLESEGVLGLRRFEHEGITLDWASLKYEDGARGFAKALLALTNLVWDVMVDTPGAVESDLFFTAQEETWLKDESLIELARRHAHDIDPVLNIIDERHVLDTVEIERILSEGVLSTGVL